MKFKIKFTKNRNIQYKTLLKCGINNIKNSYTRQF